MAKIKVPLIVKLGLLLFFGWLNKNFILFYFPYFVFGIIGWIIIILHLLVFRALLKDLKAFWNESPEKIAKEDEEEMEE